MRQPSFAAIAVILVLNSSCDPHKAESTTHREAFTSPSSLATASPPALTRNQQKRFTPEDAMESEVPLPNEIWEHIVQQERNPVIKNQLVSRNDPEYWVGAAKVRINADTQDDYIIMAKQSPLLGANVTAFWIYASDGRGYRRIFDGSALLLEFLDSATNGAPDLRISAATAKSSWAKEFQFNGTEYMSRR